MRLSSHERNHPISDDFLLKRQCLSDDFFIRVELWLQTIRLMPSNPRFKPMTLA